MSALLLAPIDRARKISSTILRAVQQDGTQVSLAAAMGVSESTVSRLINPESLDKLALLLAHAGLKVVPLHMKCYPSDYMQALHTLARLHVEDGPKLEWD